MNILYSVLKELFGMFVADLRLTASVLVLVALVAWLTADKAAPVLSGGLLLLGSLAIVLEAVWRQARSTRKSRRV